MPRRSARPEFEGLGMLRALLTQRLWAVFVGGWALLNFPLLTLWGGDVRVGGLPLLPVALFLIWAGLIGLVAWLVERQPD